MEVGAEPFPAWERSCFLLSGVPCSSELLGEVDVFDLGIRLDVVVHGMGFLFSFAVPVKHFLVQLCNHLKP